ncbi:L-serine dehydratase 1 [bioreactor metagenome]|uniref:L-serine dehydratase 1 n=1 Tax=bioreactor metagenome TaxID=1076179 RepID=A0A645CDV4_9ZZZZ|nr:L-serine ammonia-lyase, iron-sulfur-dependent, subunit alpha [Erysipelotrichaceae bacterium]
MESLQELYRIGPGPSSSHTLAPQRACQLYMEHYPNAIYFDVMLFGSLALTGVGHATDEIIRKTFAPRMCTICFKEKHKAAFPNGLRIRGYNIDGSLESEWTVFSLGGGSIEVAEEDLHLHDEIYPHDHMNQILDYCQEYKISLADYPMRYEPEIVKHLGSVLNQMLKTVSSGLAASGVLPGSLKLPRVAKGLFLQANLIEEGADRTKILLSSYAYAACEENADGKSCVAAPTMGASGIMAALVYHYYHDVGLSRAKLIKGLALAGLFGNVVKKNATISGAVGGCQAEVGTACAMGSAMIAYFNGLNNRLIAYAAEIGMEHHLGLTCDPVGGYVMIPCIERNAVATLRAIDSALLAQHVGALKNNRVSFDDVVRTMRYTGMKLPLELRETSLGGLATEIALTQQTELVDEPETHNLDDYMTSAELFKNLDFDQTEADEIDNKLNIKF